MPDIQVNFLAVLIAVVANFFFGFVWYTLLFGRLWAVEMGYNPDEKPEKSAMFKGMSLMIVGNFFLAWVFAHNIAVWNPESWGMSATDMPSIANAAMAAFFIWLGFYVPVHLSGIAWEKNSWRLFAINATYHLLSLMLVATILIHI